MARQYAAIKIAIWGDDDFTSLPLPSQWLYFHLVSHPTLSLVGIADWRPRKIVPKAHGLTLPEVMGAADELAAHRYVILDEDTEEVLIRSFLRNDSTLKTPKMADGIIRAYAAIASRNLKSHVAREMRRVHGEHPEYTSFQGGKLDQILERAAQFDVGIDDRIDVGIDVPFDVRDLDWIADAATHTHTGTPNHEP